MSRQQPSSIDRNQYVDLDPNVLPATEAYGEEPLPSFRSFPARTRESAHIGGSYERPSGGYPPAHSGVISGLPYHTQAADDVSIHGSRHSATGEGSAYRQRTSTLPALPSFTPFPAAARSSRYGPPPGSRTEPARPCLPPLFTPESTSGSRRTTAPLEPPAAGSTPASRVPSGLPPGLPSFYAPPGPLTAKPHVCEFCDSGFARAHDLKRHLETHKGERPHKCPNCNRPFSRKDAVQRHLLVTQCGIGSSGTPSST